MGRITCEKNCDQYGPGNITECDYSCRDKQILRLHDDHEVDKFVKELYKASGIYVSPSSIYKYKKIIEEFL